MRLRAQRRSIRVFALGAVACLAAGGCGGTVPFDADAKADAKTDRTSDLVVAKSAVLRQADLPDFTATPSENSGDFTDEEVRLLAKCLKVDVDVLQDTQGAQVADSPDFERGDLTISSGIEIHPTARTIETVFDVFENPRFGDCLSVLFAFTLAKEPTQPGVEIGVPRLERHGSKLGDRASRFMGTVDITAHGVVAVTLHMEMVFVQRGRALVMFASNDQAPLDTARSSRLITKMLNRLQGHN